MFFFFFSFIWLFFFFFFSSRRRHTRFSRDWSSDVCSSDLFSLPATGEELERAKENVKARIILALESSSARMNRLGGSVMYGLPLLEPDELMASIDAVS